MVVNKLSWMIGGTQGSGVDLSANLFARACAVYGLHIYGKREYYSNIKGMHSYFIVRVDNKPIRSHLNHINLLATFDAETIVRHSIDVLPEGGIIYDPQIVNTNLSEIPTIEQTVKENLASHLATKEQGVMVNDFLTDANNRGIHLYPLPYLEIVKKIADDFKETKISRLTRTINTIAVAASLSLLGLDLEVLNGVIDSIFKEKVKMVEMNIAASQKAFEYCRSKFKDDMNGRLERITTNEERLLWTGNQAVALGKMLGGCRFQTYYPITPAADESLYLEAHELPEIDLAQRIENPQLEESLVLKGGAVLVVQTEDEIAAIASATGACLTGARSATCTSGPGFSLMVEGLSWAGMNEIPIVVTHYQRAAPSTGLPTRHEQGDLLFAIHAGHGEFPRIVLASGDLEECFHDAALAFNYAERFQMPVVHLIDKALANSTYTSRTLDLQIVKIDRGMLIYGDNLGTMKQTTQIYQRFAFSDSGISKRVTLGSRGSVFWCTGDEHDEFGHISEDPVNRTDMMDKRMRKTETAGNEISETEKWNFFGEKDADATVVSWGSPKGAILEANDRLREEGFRVNFLQMRLLNPFPEESVVRILNQARIKIDVEMNYSAQLSRLIREHTGVRMDCLIVKYNGRPMSCDEIYTAIREVLSGKAPRRTVLSNGT